jgi:hypothetical protein
MQEVHNVKVAVTIDIEQFENKLIEEVVGVLSPEDLKFFDKGGESNLLFVKAAGQHEVNKFGEVGLAIAKDVFEVGNDVFFREVAALLEEFGLV